MHLQICSRRILGRQALHPQLAFFVVWTICATALMVHLHNCTNCFLNGTLGVTFSQRNIQLPPKQMKQMGQTRNFYPGRCRRHKRTHRSGAAVRQIQWSDFMAVVLGPPVQVLPLRDVRQPPPGLYGEGLVGGGLEPHLEEGGSTPPTHHGTAQNKIPSAQGGGNCPCKFCRGRRQTDQSTNFCRGRSCWGVVHCEPRKTDLNRRHFYVIFSVLTCWLALLAPLIASAPHIWGEKIVNSTAKLSLMQWLQYQQQRMLSRLLFYQPDQPEGEGDVLCSAFP